MPPFTLEPPEIVVGYCRSLAGMPINSDWSITASSLPNNCGKSEETALRPCDTNNNGGTNVDANQFTADMKQDLQYSIIGRPAQ